MITSGRRRITGVMCEYNHVCASSLELGVSERRSSVLSKKSRRDNVNGGMKKYQLTEDMTQDRKYWMAKIMHGRAQGHEKLTNLA